MKRLVVLLALMLLSFGLTNAENRVTVTLAQGDTIFIEKPVNWNIAIANDEKLGGTSLGFEMSSTDGVTWDFLEVGGFAVTGPTPKFLKGVPGTRWMPGGGIDGSCWDLGGTQVTTTLAPAQFLVGGAALSGGLNAGTSQIMLEAHFKAHGLEDGTVQHLCIDSAFYPPAGNFIFVGTATVTPNYTGGCWPVTKQQDPCPVWDQGLPASMSMSHCGPAGSVTLHATDGEPDPSTVMYFLHSFTGGDGTPTVGQLTGVVTYNPAMTDVGKTITIEVEATDANHQEGGCPDNIWAIDVVVTNNPISANCGVLYTPIGKGNPVHKTDIKTIDPDACDVPQLVSVVATPPFVAGNGTVTYNGSHNWTYDVMTAANYDDVGMHNVCVTFTDGFTEASCCFNIEVLAVEPWEVQIEKTHNTLQGHFVDVNITLNKGSEPMGGFDFLIGYDASALAFTEAALGGYFVQCGWEYFTYRFNWNGNCGNACPTGLLRIVGLAETNNGANHPDFDCIKAASEVDAVIATLTFFVSNDRTLECMYVPIRFYWMDCGDNTISTISGDSLAMNRYIYDYVNDMNEIQDYAYGFPGYVGAPDYCLEGDKVVPVRFIDFINGGIDIVCGDSIDARGDINCNGVKNEVADAVMFTNYFISGLSAFGGHIEASIAASDVNADGIALSVADLVYLIRVIVGDANPYPKPLPDAHAVVNAQAGKITVNAPVNLGAALLTFQVNGEVGTPVVGVDMDMKYTVDGNQMRVLIFNIGSKSIPAGENVLVTVPGNVELTNVEVASYEGSMVDAMVNRIPVNYELKNFPNPFNPATTIMLSLPVASDWTIEIYNVAGQLVRDFSGHSEAGVVTQTWNGTDNNGKTVASGIYFYRAKAEQFSQTKKMMLMK